MKKITVISGKPSPEELEVLQIVADNHNRIEKSPLVKRSNWATPLMRPKLPQEIEFGAGRNI